jgi:hypothetical protein
MEKYIFIKNVMLEQAQKNTQTTIRMFQVMIKYLCNSQIMPFKRMGRITANLKKAILSRRMPYLNLYHNVNTMLTNFRKMSWKIISKKIYKSL